MNTPNKITILRMLLVPLFMAFMLLDISQGKVIAMVLFALAAATDSLDGYLARRNNQVTTLGKFLDPLADKLLIIAALVCMVELGLVNSWVTMIIVAREFAVTTFRIVAIGEGKVLAADIWGKLKTVMQIAAVIMVMADYYALHTGWLGNTFMAVAVVLTIVSGCNYIFRNWSVLANSAK